MGHLCNGDASMRKIAATAIIAAIATLANTNPGRAQDTLRLAVGQRGLWDTSVSDVGQRAGIFNKHGLRLEILYTQGSGETQQAVIAGSVEIAVSVGVMGVLSAYSKGAPVRIIGAEMTGAGDLFWYVRADSPIRTLADADGKTIAYSTNGSSTHGVVTAFVKQYLPNAKPTPTGGPAATLTAVMSGQVDVGWAAPPFALDQLDFVTRSDRSPPATTRCSKGRPCASSLPPLRTCRAAAMPSTAISPRIARPWIGCIPILLR
jgi:NitT/TauT family transport system substrate-binding protein